MLPGVKSAWCKKFSASELPGVNKRCLVEKVSGEKGAWCERCLV